VKEERSPPTKFSAPEKYVRHSLKLLDMVQKCEPLSANSSPLVSQAGYGHGYHYLGTKNQGNSKKKKMLFLQPA